MIICKSKKNATRKAKTMIVIKLTYPNGREIIRNVFVSQAQMIINAMRADGCKVEILSNPTDEIVK